MNKIVIKNATVLTVNKEKEILKNYDILINNNLIEKIEKNIICNDAKYIDASNKIVMPGFIQTHIHLCQTLFRGMAERRELLYWLREKIWPLEAAHTPNSTYYSAMLGIGEMLSGGTTTILDMGGVNHTEQAFQAIKNSGIRAFAGKAMMDQGIGVPANILETTENSINDSMKLYEKWNNAENGRINYAFAPRFILSCSNNLFKEIKVLSDKYKIPVHTHSSENKSEGAEVEAIVGSKEFEYFEKIGVLNERFLAAHCIWCDDKDLEIIKKYGVKVLHCPSSNFKLGSGMANLKRFIDNKVCVSIGADGAPCNNNLDMLQEVRTTALMQNVLNSVKAIDAYKYLELATIEGAKALGIEKEVGSLEIGKKADIQILNLEDDFSTFGSDDVDLATKIVFSASKQNVETVIVDGKIVVENKNMKTINKKEVLDNCKSELKQMLTSSLSC